MEQEEKIIDEIEVQKEANRSEEIEVRLQEIEVLLDKIDMKVMQGEPQEQYAEEYQRLKEEHHSLIKEQKQIKKGMKTDLDKIPIWMIIYSVILLFLCFPLLSYQLWLSFANFLIDSFGETLTAFQTNSPDFVFKAVLLLMIYALPLILILVSWLVYVNFVKKPFEKKFFLIIWGIQILFTIGLGIWLYVEVVKDVIM